MKKILFNPLAFMYFKMSCDIVGGFGEGCSNGRGGISDVTFIQKDLLDATNPYTLDADNQVTAINLQSGARGYKYDLTLNISTFTDVMTKDRANGTLSAIQTLTMVLNDNRVSTRNNLVLLAQNNLLAVVHLADGTYELLGADNGLSLETDTRDAGTVKLDRNGHTVVMVGDENELAYPVDSTIVAGLLIPVS